MNKIKFLLILILLTACTAPKQGHFIAECDYTVGDDGKVNLTCVQVGTSTPDRTPTLTSIPPTPLPSPTRTPTTVPSVTPTATGTSVSSNVNLFANPGFEGGGIIYTWSDGLRLPEVATVDKWNPFFCDFPYKTGPCPAKFQGTKNPSNLLMGRPEMRNTTVSYRVHGGSGAQYLFCQFRACDGGVYQTVRTSPGQTCTASVYVQSWSRDVWNSKISNEENFRHSTFPNEDGYSNSLWRVVVDPYGGVNIDSTNVVRSSWYSLPHSISNVDNQVIEILDHYDKFAQISLTFTARGSFSTVYFENLRLFPFTFNDSMIDDAEIKCTGGNSSTATPVPISTLVPDILVPANVDYKVIKPILYVYKTRNINDIVIMSYHDSDRIKVKCVVESPMNTYWGSTFGCSPEPTQWFIIQSGDDKNIEVNQGPEGY